jgi:hypothetical protein
MQELVCADLDLTATGGLSQGRQADRHARQDWLQKRHGLVGQAENLVVQFLRAAPVGTCQQHRLAGAETDRVVHPCAAAPQALAQRHHRAGLECPVPRLRIQVADDRVPCGAHRRQLEVLRDLLGAESLQTLPGLPLVVAGVARRAGKLDVAKARQVGMNAPVVLGQRPTDLGRESAGASFADVVEQGAGFEHAIAPGLGLVVEHRLGFEGLLQRRAAAARASFSTRSAARRNRSWLRREACNSAMSVSSNSVTRRKQVISTVWRCRSMRAVIDGRRIWTWAA